MKPYISLIIPTYNEEDRLGNSLKIAISYLYTTHYLFEIIVSDDGSTDKTIEIAKQFPEVNAIVAKRNLGKGAAVKRGILAAEGDIRVFSDADLSTPIYEIDKLIRFLNNGTDICIGSRALNENLIKKHQPFYREFMGKTFNRIVQTFVLKGISDTQCGFKGFTEEAAIKIFSNSIIEHFGFDVEILYLARKFGFSIKEIPVEWFNDERSKVDPVKDSIKMLFDILKIRKLHSKK